jgi:hypothetical protein
MVNQRLIGAACSLGADELRELVRAWRDLRDHAISVDRIPGGARLGFGPDQPMEAVAELMVAESECCAFYTFSLQVDGPTRWLDITAGAGAEPTAAALLGLDQLGAAPGRARRYPWPSWIPSSRSVASSYALSRRTVELPGQPLGSRHDGQPGSVAGELHERSVGDGITRLVGHEAHLAQVEVGALQQLVRIGHPGPILEAEVDMLALRRDECEIS